VIRRKLLIYVLTALVAASASAGTRGRISGSAQDDMDLPVVFATVTVLGTQLNAHTDEQGQFMIHDVEPGSYAVRIEAPGFDTVTMTDVEVSADQTAKIQFKMREIAFQMEDVVVTSIRPPVELGLTSSQANLSIEEIESLPVQNLSDVVNLQAGVVDGHFRGGRDGEVQFQVDGMSVNNAFDNRSSVSVDRSLLREVQIISGTFDAEYGQAMSGVVNAVLKSGTEDLVWNVEAYTGSFFYPGRGELRALDETFHPATTRNYQIGLSGPTPLPDTVFLLSGRRYVFEDYAWGERRFNPDDSADFPTLTFSPTGDGEETALGYNREWSGMAKLTNTSLEHTRLNYQALMGDTRSRANDWAFRFNPDGLSVQRRWSIAHGLDVNHHLGGSTYFDFSVRQNYMKYEDKAYDDIMDPRYDAASYPDGDAGYEDGAYVQGVQFTRYIQESDTWLFKTSLASQIARQHAVKTGLELSLPKVRFGNTGYLYYSLLGGAEQLVRSTEDASGFPLAKTYEPVTMAAYVQDTAELDDLTVRCGLRFESFDARSTVPSDLANPANTIAGVPESEMLPTTVKRSLSPRLGLSFPIGDDAALHASYGHFRQFPGLGQIFSNIDYRRLEELQASDAVFAMGNPDIKPEVTIQYEVGFKKALSRDFGFEVTTFYKDIRDLLGVEFLELYNGAQYSRLTNTDFGNVFGLTLALDHRSLGPLSVGLDYTWQQATGNSSDPLETAVRAANGEDSRPRLVPFNWDQRHTLNLSAAYGTPDGLSLSTVLRYQSGQPYTPVIAQGFGNGLEVNSGRKPASLTVDLRGEHPLGLVGGAKLFFRVFNLTDSRFVNGAVFADTGSPYYSRFPEADRITLNDPTRYNAPRRIEIGVRLGGGR
jgi:hypothetical protein